MAGGLVQIVSHGTMDLTLTGNPEITFFNIIFRRYTNFGLQIKHLSFDNDTFFGNTSIITIPKTGQLLSKLILEIELPAIDFDEINKTSKANNSEKYFSDYTIFFDFLNKLKNIVNNFFTSTANENGDYPKDFSNFVLKYLDLNNFNTFFITISYFFDNTEKSNFLLSSYYNASLFQIVDLKLQFIYRNWDKNTNTFDMFKNAIYENIIILDSLNDYLYSKVLFFSTEQSLFEISWIEDIAINLFDKIDLFIGSNKINTLSNFYIRNYGELHYENKGVYDKMIGKNIKFNNSLEKKTVYLIIPFWFNKNYGLSIPVVANHFNSIQVKLYIKDFEECIKLKINSEYYNLKYDVLKNIIENYYNEYNKLQITMLAEYVYLDKLETMKFASYSHEYLITQTQELEFNNINLKGSYGLDFYHCCKELYWNIIKKFEIDDVFSYEQEIIIPNASSFYYKILYDTSKKFNLNEYVVSLIEIYNKNNKIESIENIFNEIFKKSANLYENTFIKNAIAINSGIFCNQKGNFYRFLHPYIYYNSISLASNTNVYSFCLVPTEYQPSGTINFSKIPTISISSVINDKFKKNIDKYKMVVSTTNYNILRFVGGVVGLAFTYNF
jgi:hypothetical protein